MKKIILSCLLAIAIFVWLGDDVLELLSGHAPEQPTCQAVQIKRGDIYLKISGRGVIKPKQIIKVIPRKTGQILKIMVKEGQTVKKGQRLIKIKPETNYTLKLYDIKQGLTDSNVKLKTTKKNLERQKQLLSEGLVAQIKVEDAEKAYAAAVRGANAALARSKIFEKDTGIKIDDLKIDSPASIPQIFSYITAPISGTVLDISIHIGEIITPNPSFYQYNPPIIIADMRQFLVEYEVNEIDVDKIKIGQVAEIRLDSYPDTVFYGSITKVPAIHSQPPDRPGIRRQSNLVFFKVTILLKRADIDLKIGMSCRVNIILKKIENIQLAPVEAIAKNNGKKFIYIMKNGSFIRQIVTTGVSDENFIEIKSKLADDTLLCNHPLTVLEWEEQRRIFNQQSFIEKILK